MISFREDKFQGDLENPPSNLYKALKYLDFMLPLSIAEKDEDLRFKARFAALDMLTGFFLTLFGLFSNGVLNFTFFAALFFLQHVIFLLWLKVSRHTELVLTTFVCFSLAVSCTLTFGFSNTILTPGQLYWFRLIMLSFILCRFQVTIVIWLIIILASLALYPFGLHTGFQTAFHADFQRLIGHYSYRVLTMNIWALVSVAAFRGLLRFTNQSVQRESEWVIQSAKIRQLALLAANLSSLFENSLSKMRQELSTLEREFDKPDFPFQERRSLRNLEDLHKHIREASRSFSLIYNAQKEAALTTVTLREISNHIRLLLSELSMKTGWRLQIDNSDPLVELNVPLAKLLLLIISVCHQLQEDDDAVADRILCLSTTCEDQAIVWTIVWMNGASDFPLSVERIPLGPEFVKQENLSIIQELLMECDLSMKMYQYGAIRVAKLRQNRTRMKGEQKRSIP